MQRGFWENLARPIIGLAPMDGVSDAPFRFITATHGKPSLLITEFTNVEALNHGAVKALSAFVYDEIERPVVAQVYGTNPDAFYKACFVAAELGFDGIDINMGCPSRAVSGNGAGAGLIRTPMLAQEIIRACQQAAQDWANGKTIYEAQIHRDIINYIEKIQAGTPVADTFPKPAFNPIRRVLPISVKTRIGYDKIVTEDWIKNILECQPANISLHGRTLKQMYTGAANWQEIARAAEIIHSSGLPTTLLGNGDIKTFTEALEKISTHGVDGVLIGRGAFGEPWIFENPQANCEPRPRTIEEKLAVALAHARRYEATFGIGAKSYAPMKKHFGWYCGGFPYAKELRVKLMRTENADQLEQVIQDFLSGINLPVGEVTKNI